jgi:threonyl-tRNA synthetase
MEDHDHKVLGRRLGIYATDPLVGSGLPMWLPAGAAVRAELEQYIREEERRAGYVHVYTPPVGKRELYELSGHLDHFGEDMFPAIEVDGEHLILRPSLCPHHIRVFAQSERTYRDLPLRLAELGAQFRWERSGVVGGLARVRAMTLNDAHVFCTLDQIAGEFAVILQMISSAYDALGIAAHRYRLSLRGEGHKYFDDDDMWEKAESVLRSTLDGARVDYQEVAGEAAFYGPKLDVQVLDHRGREETLSTVQIDFLLPRRFGLSYVAPGGAKEAPVLVHRSIISTMERMVAHLLEVHAGALPVWLSPVQVVVIPVADAWSVAAHDAARGLLSAGVRVEVDDSGETVALRVRRALERKVPYVAVVGEREAAGGAVAVRERGGRNLGVMTVGDVAALTRRR